MPTTISSGLQDALTELGLADNTNILISADHGFSTVSKQSETSGSRQGDVCGRSGRLSCPPGFMSIDIAKGLGVSLYDPDSQNALVAITRIRGSAATA